MVKGVVKCSSNCSNPELPGTVDIFTGLGPGTWNISAQNRVIANNLIIDEYYILSPIEPQVATGLSYINVHDETPFASTVIYLTNFSSTIFRYKGSYMDGIALGDDHILYEFVAVTSESGYFYAADGDGSRDGNYFVSIATTGVHVPTS